MENLVQSSLRKLRKLSCLVEVAFCNFDHVGFAESSFDDMRHCEHH